MIVTVTANTTMDHVLFIPSFVPGETIRATSWVDTMGGKPTDASWILGGFDIPSKAFGLAAGAIGMKIRGILEARGVEVDFVEVGGESRISTLIVAEDDGSQTTITPHSLEVEPHHVEELFRKVEAALPDATVMVLGGSLPPSMDPSFYSELVTLANKYEVKTVFDAKPENLIAGMKVGVNFIKPNRGELSGVVGRPVETIQDAYEAGCEVRDEYGTSLAISLDKDGAMAILPDKAYHIPAIEIDVVSAVGAGDAVLAGVALALFRDDPIEEGLRFGVATATAVCLQMGTAVYERADAERFMPQVQLIPYP